MGNTATATITLDYPIEIDGQIINEITMRRPKGRDILKASKAKGNDVERGFAMMADLTEQPLEILHELDEVDLDKLGEQLEAFKQRQAETPVP